MAFLLGSFIAGAVASASPRRPVEPGRRFAGLAGLAAADLLWIRAAQDIPYGPNLPPDEVERNYRRLRLALRIAPERTARAVGGGLGLTFWGRNDLAFALLEEAFERRPTDERIIVALGVAQALRRQNDPRLAARFLERATAFPDAPPVAWKLLAHARELSGDDAGAIEAWRTVDERFGERFPYDREQARAEIGRLRRSGGHRLPATPAYPPQRI